MSDTVSQLFGLSAVKQYKGKNNPDKATNDSLLIGLELEIENLPNGLTWYMDRAAPFWNVVEDGSLRPRGESWEFVSRPASIGTALAELRLFFERFGFTDANYSDRCSIHVHTNVQDFTKEQVANIALIYPVFETVLFQYVNHFKAPDAQGYCRDTNLYCIPWNACRMNRNFVEKFFDDHEGIRDQRDRFGSRPRWEKYTALNMLPIGQHGTVEWRHMHGTADMEKITTWLNVIGNIMHYCKTHEFSEIVKTIKVLNDVSTYQQFFQDVLAGALPYNETYRQAMAEGVVGAKYSLINWEANKGTEKPSKEEKAKKRASSLYDGMAAAAGWAEPPGADAPAEDGQLTPREIIARDRERRDREIIRREQARRQIDAAQAQLQAAAARVPLAGAAAVDLDFDRWYNQAMDGIPDPMPVPEIPAPAAVERHAPIPRFPLRGRNPR